MISFSLSVGEKKLWIYRTGLSGKVGNTSVKLLSPVGVDCLFRGCSSHVPQSKRSDRSRVTSHLRRSEASPFQRYLWRCL